VCCLCFDFAVGPQHLPQRFAGEINGGRPQIHGQFHLRRIDKIGGHRFLKRDQGYVLVRLDLAKLEEHHLDPLFMDIRQATHDAARLRMFLAAHCRAAFSTEREVMGEVSSSKENANSTSLRCHA
jgi:hypothetical protein